MATYFSIFAWRIPMTTPKPSVPITTLVCLGYFTRYHRLGSLNNRNLFLRVLAAGSQRSECWHGQVLVKAFFLTCRLLHFCCVLTWWRKRGSLPSISYQGNNPITVAPPQDSSHPKAPTPDTITLGLGFNIRIFGAQTFSP